MKYIFSLLTIVIFFIGCGDNDNNDVLNRSLIVPAYGYGIPWEKFNKAGSFIIVNPDNGSGDKVDSYYLDVINTLSKNNQIVLGYFYTKYGQRNIQEVKNEIDKWLDFYKIDGFFVDEVTRNSEYEFYKEIYEYIKSKGDYVVVLNPGTKPSDEFFSIADNIIVFENPYDRLNDIDSNICKTHYDKSSIIVYEANQAQMEEMIKKFNCKYIYATDDVLPNPYDELPTYFEALKSIQ
jgi:hypothetical protein